MTNSKPLKKRIKNWFIYKVVKYGLWFINAINRKTAFRFFTTLGWLGYYLVKSERNKTIENLKYVFGNKYTQKQYKAMSKDVFINLTRNMVDAFRISIFDSNTINNYVTATGLEKINQALKKGNGVIAITAHVGSWELLAAYLAFKGYPLHVIGAPVYDSRIDELVIKNRTVSGAKYIARGSATRQILRALKNNEIVGILMDQDSKRNDGVFIDFFGHEAYTPSGPVVLAMKTGASIVPMAIHIKNDYTHFVEVKDEIKLQITDNKDQDIEINTLNCSKVLESFIEKNLTQWVWMHERWKTKNEEFELNDSN